MSENLCVASKKCYKTKRKKSTKKLTSVSDKKVQLLFMRLIGFTPHSIIRDIENDTITCTIKTSHIGGIEEDMYVSKETIVLTKNSIESDSYSLSEDVLYKYQQWLVAMHVHPLQENNPFINRRTKNKVGLSNDARIFTRAKRKIPTKTNIFQKY